VSARVERAPEGGQKKRFTCFAFLFGLAIFSSVATAESYDIRRNQSDGNCRVWAQVKMSRWGFGRQMRICAEHAKMGESAVERFVFIFMTLAATLILTACGGGAGTGSSPILPDTEIGQLKAESRVLQLERIVDRSDTLLISGFHMRYGIDTEGDEPATFYGWRGLPNLQGETLRDYLNTSCAGGRCIVDDTLVNINTQRDRRTVINAQSLLDPSVDIDPSQVALGSPGDFDTARTPGVFDISGSVQDPCGSDTCDVSAAVVPAATGYALSGSYGYAAVEVANGFWSGQVQLSMLGREIGDLPFEGELSYAWAYALGRATGTNPASGRATWRGIAEAASTHTLERHRGTALVTVPDMSNPQVSVEVHIEGHAIGPETWDDIPLADGHFVIGNAESDYLEGNFHGPDHSETYGVFDTDTHIGAFGAKRD